MVYNNYCITACLSCSSRNNHKNPQIFTQIHKYFQILFFSRLRYQEFLQLGPKPHYGLDRQARIHFGGVPPNCATGDELGKISTCVSTFFWPTEKMCNALTWSLCENFLMKTVATVLVASNKLTRDKVTCPDQLQTRTQQALSLIIFPSDDQDSQ